MFPSIGIIRPVSGDDSSGTHRPGRQDWKVSGFADMLAGTLNSQFVQKPGDPDMRARWNNDFKNHCSEWSDKDASMPCLSTE